MNSIDDLRGEFSVLAAGAPADDAVRAAFELRVAQRDKRRRTTALVAVAAAVVLVAGGIGVTSAMLRSAPSTVGPASPPAVVTVPDVPLPEGTQLIRHQLRPVTSPVTATPPAGLTGMTWMQSPGRLGVSFFDVAAAAGGTVENRDAVRAAGYVITDGADDPVWTFGQGGSKAASATKRSILVGDHDATLETAPSGAMDAMGFPAAQRLSWQLPDGRYIHVWAIGLPTRDSSPDTALKDFAEAITDSTHTLPRTIGLGLTLPGLTADSTMNSMPIAGYIGGSVLMCPSGVDPYAMSFDQASVSGTSTASSGTSAAPWEPGGTDTYEGSIAPAGNPTAPCLTVGVVNATGADLGSGERTRIAVDGVQVSVSPDDQTAAVDLGNGLIAGVAVPDSITLSDADLAALAASVRLSPSVAVIPLNVSGSQGSGVASASGSASAVSSSAATVQSGAAGARPPATDHAIDVDRDDDVIGAVASDGATATVEFTLRNANADPRNLQSLRLDVPGMTQTGLKVRLDNTAADSDTPSQDAVLPAMFAPGTRVRIRVELRVDQCSVAASGQPTLNVEWQAGSSGGGFSEALPITDPAGGLTDLLSPLCK
jgi:hypothetical protein